MENSNDFRNNTLVEHRPNSSFENSSKIKFYKEKIESKLVRPLQERRVTC